MLNFSGFFTFIPLPSLSLFLPCLSLPVNTCNICFLGEIRKKSYLGTSHILSFVVIFKDVAEHLL